MVQVVAALIRKGNTFMICQRPAHKARGLLWEFPGGKIEPGETGPEALIRECREELGVTISVGDVFYEVDHVYPDITIHLTLYNAAVAEGTPQLLEHNDLRYISPSEIDGYDFCPADVDILKEIQKRF
ncbi:MAG: (deoxy)nucleoside triphosphate pyrophosphohydrolase [Clostridia bacterium]|nr:(deoxy)nucleoside triphosphate pyrophosphohydrolase [Clostridia bacterium]